MVAWLQAKWGRARKCPYCATVKWDIDPVLVSVMRVNQPLLIPYVAVTCANCGNTVLISAERAGVAEPPGQ